MASFHRQPG